MPFDYDGDALYFEMVVKAVVDHGWFLDQPVARRAAACSHARLPVGRRAHLLVIKVMSLGTSDWALLYNLYFILSFPLITVSALGLRHFRSPYAPGAGRQPALLFSALAAVAGRGALFPVHLLRGAAGHPGGALGGGGRSAARLAARARAHARRGRDLRAHRRHGDLLRVLRGGADRARGDLGGAAAAHAAQRARGVVVHGRHHDRARGAGRAGRRSSRAALAPNAGWRRAIRATPRYSACGSRSSSCRWPSIRYRPCAI